MNTNKNLTIVWLFGYSGNLNNQTDWMRKSYVACTGQDNKLNNKIET